MRPERDYYEVLGVARDADSKTIKRSFLKLARELHPDVNDAPDAEAKFKEVNEAYSVLSDEHKRANYDRFGDAEGPGGFGGDYVDLSDIFGGGFGVSDIFESFFGGAARGYSPMQRSAGRDMNIRLTITLEEAAAGCSKTISYDRLAPCEDCNATGSASQAAPKTCEHCNGTGSVTEVRRTVFGQMRSQSTCPVCNGQGQLIEDPCESCTGQGRTPSHEKLKVDIPAGIRSGQSIRIPSMGEAGVRGAASGDLLVTVEVAAHERFERAGDELGVQLEVDAFDAMLGTSIEIDGILEDEKVTVEIPAGTQFGDRISCKGHGMPRYRSDTRGDLTVLVTVNVPDDLSDADKKALEKLRKTRKKS